MGTPIMRTCIGLFAHMRRSLVHAEPCTYYAPAFQAGVYTPSSTIHTRSHTQYIHPLIHNTYTQLYDACNDKAIYIICVCSSSGKNTPTPCKKRLYAVVKTLICCSVKRLRAVVKIRTFGVGCRID